MPEKKPSSVTGPNVQKLPMQRNLAVSGLAGIALSAISCLAALAADGAPIPLKSITLDGQKQLVIEFSTRGGAFPTVPHLLDLPGPNHRVVVDLTGATIEKGTLQSPEELSTSINKAVPGIKSLRYYNQANTEKPTARIVLDLPEALKAEPRVVKVDETSVTIDLGAEIASAGAEKPAAPATAEAAPGDAPVAAAAAPAEAVNTIADTTAAPTPFAAAEANAATPADKSSDGVQKIQQPETQVGTSKAGAGWDWSGNASTPTATPNESKPNGAAMQPVASPSVAQALPQSGDTVDGVAPVSSTRTVAQPAAAAEAAELRPAIGGGSAPVAASSDQPLISQPTGAAAVVTPTIQEATPTGAKASVKLYNSAVRNHLAGKLADAINDYKGAIAANPQLAEAHSNLGLIYNQQHNYAQALAEFRKALAINPKDAITYNGIGAALRAERDLPGAIKNWQTAVQLDPHLATAHYNLGTAFEIQKDYDRALEAYKEAVKNDYRLGEAYYRMGLIQQEKKHQNEEALTQFKEALKISADSEYSDDARQRIAQFTKTATATKH